VSLKLLERKRRFVMRPPVYCGSDLVAFVREVLEKQAAKSRELVASSRLL
jgi:hypothetical protein